MTAVPTQPNPSPTPPRRQRRGLLGVAGRVGSLALAGVLVAVLVVSRPWETKPVETPLRPPEMRAKPQAVWTANLPDAAIANGVLDPGRLHRDQRDRLIVDTTVDDGAITALDPATGAEQWRATNLEDALCAIGHASAVVCVHEDRATLFDLRDGREIRSFGVPAHAVDLQAATDGLVLLTYDLPGRTPVAAHRLTWDGITRWSTQVAAAGDYSIGAGPRLTLAGDRLIATAPLETESADAALRFEDGEPVAQGGALSFAPDGSLVRSKADGTAEVLDRDGKARFSLSGSLLTISTDAAPGSAPLVVSGEDGVSRWDADGRRVWSSEKLLWPTAACGGVLLEAMDGRLAAVDLATGKDAWEATTAVSAPRLTCNGDRVLATWAIDGPSEEQQPAAESFDLRTGDLAWALPVERATVTTAGLVETSPGQVALYR